MNNIFFNEDVLAAEKNISISLGIPALILMENAGANSAAYILQNYTGQLANEAIILAGKGNNAGDGFVLARHLLNTGKRVKMLMLYTADELKGDALINYTILKHLHSDMLKICFCKDDKSLIGEINKENIIIIDAIFGIGFRGEPDFRIKNIFEAVNRLTEKIIISLDIPSGLYNYNQTSCCIKADVTLTMGVKKFDLLFYRGRDYSGIKEVVNIGISANEFTKYNNNKIYETVESDVKMYLPGRKTESNKYENGKVLAIAGSRGLTGAAALCSLSALRSGCGAVITACPKSVNDILEIKLTEVMTLPLHETNEATLSTDSYNEIKERLSWADCVLIGPGLSKNENTLSLIRRIIKDNDINFIIDADGIAALKENLDLLNKSKGKIILTPHYGEFSKLIGVDVDILKNDFYQQSRNFAAKYKVILVLKNSPSIITDGESFYINSVGRENLATAGTGDVLSGIIASLYSRTKDALHSAVAGCYMHGKCSEELYVKYGSSSMIASDIIAQIPHTIKNIEFGEN